MFDARLHLSRLNCRAKAVSRDTGQVRTANGGTMNLHNAPALVFKLLAVLLIVLPVGACSLSRTAALEDERALVTSSISQPMEAEGIDRTDVEVIKTAVAEAQNSQSEAPELAWSNPDTGNRGTIKAIDKFVGSHGQQCKKFQTTVDNFKGISLYNGETCELKKDSWVLSWFLRE
jgi:surface antigen